MKVPLLVEFKDQLNINWQAIYKIIVETLGKQM
jgi:hypothetical protein